MLSAGQPRQRKKTGESCGPQLSPVDFWDDFILIFNKSKIIFKNEPVTLRMVWAERRQIHRQRRSTAFPNVANTSFRKPIRRSSFQICSTGFISGVYGGRKNNLMLSGSRRASDLCHAAPPQHSGQNGSRELSRKGSRLPLLQRRQPHPPDRLRSARWYFPAWLVTPWRSPPPTGPPAGPWTAGGAVPAVQHADGLLGGHPRHQLTHRRQIPPASAGGMPLQHQMQLLHEDLQGGHAGAHRLRRRPHRGLLAAPSPGSQG